MELLFLPTLWDNYTYPKCILDPNILNLGWPQAFSFPIDQIIFFFSGSKFQLPWALVTEAESMYVRDSSHILTELDQDQKLHTPRTFWSIFLHFPLTAFKTFICTFGPYFLCSGDPAFLSWFPWAVSVIQCKLPLIATAILKWQQLSWDVELLPGTQECNQNLHLFLKPLSTH